MKKIFCMLLVCAIMSTLISVGGITAFAADTTVDETTPSQSGNTTITYTVAEPTYTVTIPATAELDKEFNIAAENITNIHSSHNLVVRVTDWTKEAGSDGFALANGDLYIPCDVTAGVGGDKIALGDSVLSVNTDGTAPMYITLTNSDGLYAPGTYNGTMTFTIEITQESTQPLGTEGNPYIVNSEAELIAAMAKTDRDVNYIKVGQSFTATSEITLETSDKPVVLDLDGNTISFTEQDGFYFLNTADVKNGSIVAKRSAVENRNADITLTALTVTSEENCPVILYGGRNAIYDCNFNGARLGLQVDCGMHVIANVTIIGEEYGAYQYFTTVDEPTNSFILDGVSVPDDGKLYSETTYKTAGRS